MFNPPPPGPETPGPPSRTPDTNRIEAVYNRASVLLRAGVPPHEVEQELVAEGIDPDSAAAIVSELSGPPGRPSRGARRVGSRYPRDGGRPLPPVALQRDALRAAGHKNMVVGGLVCVVGLVITVGSLAAASGAGGGSYVIAWGAIVFGAVQFFRGLAQAASANH